MGYAGGITPNPTYDEVCSGLTGHTEAVLVVFDPKVIDYETLLRIFWEAHNPTQGMRQGNDVGSQYRSAIYCMDAQQQRGRSQSGALSAAPERRALRRLLPRLPTPRLCTMRRRTTSSIWRRIQEVIADSAGPASACRIDAVQSS